jgi:hypothetical protein
MMQSFVGGLDPGAGATSGYQSGVCAVWFATSDGISPKTRHDFSKLELYIRYGGSKAALAQYAGDDLFLGFRVTEEQ